MKKTPLLALALVAVGCGPPEPPTEPPPDGPWETYHDNGQVRDKGIYKDGRKCGEWSEYGETVTYDPC